VVLSVRCTASRGSVSTSSGISKIIKARAKVPFADTMSGSAKGALYNGSLVEMDEKKRIPPLLPSTERILN